MAVTILERPQGHVLSTISNAGSISSSYGTGDATVYTVAPHGLSDGDFIYIESDIEDYNGFVYVDVTSVYTFKIQRHGDGIQYIQYVQDADITYYTSTSDHGWSAAHLPITYRLLSDLSPNNSVDTIRTVSSRSNSDGYTVLNISGSLGSVSTYDYVYLDTPSDDLSGIYQIAEWISNTVIIINLAYDSAHNFTSSTVQKYYNNYNIIVRIWVGINTSHEWASKKPYELAATLNLIPDEDGEVFFSVNDIVKSYLTTRNNPLLGTMPNNIDFWTNFYIEYAESYDDSDGYALGTYTSSYTSDQSNFEGYGVNAKLEFKNLYSGYMSEYLMNNTTAKFLTLFAIPVIFGCSDDAPDCYQDISFIKPSSGDFILNKQYYSNGSPGLLEQETITGDEGVYRVPINANCAYDRLDISLIGNFVSYGAINNTSTGSTWLQTSEGDPIVTTVPSTGNSSKIGYLAFNSPAGLVEVSATWDVGSYALGTYRVTYHLLNSSLAIIASSPGEVVNSNFDTITATIDSGDIGVAYIGVTAEWVSGGGTGVFIGYGFNGALDDVTSSETKQFKIDCGCSAQDITLVWLNNLGGFDYWDFKAEKDLLVEVRETGETRQNIFPNWPRSYGANADTIRKQTYRDSNKGYTIRSQFTTQEEADALAYIKSSVLVQIQNSRRDRRTVIVDQDSFVIRQDGQKLFNIIFNVSFTDDIPSQTA